MKKIAVFILSLLACAAAVQAQNFGVSASEEAELGRKIESLRPSSGSSSGRAAPSSGRSRNSGTSGVPSGMSKSEGRAVVERYREENSRKSGSSRSNAPAGLRNGQAGADLGRVLQYSRASSEAADAGRMEEAKALQDCTFSEAGTWADYSKLPSGSGSWGPRRYELYYGQVTTHFDKEKRQSAQALAEQAQRRFQKMVYEQTGKNLSLDIDPDHLSSIMEDGGKAISDYVGSRIGETLERNGVEGSVSDNISDNLGSSMSGVINSEAEKISRRSAQLEALKAKIKERCKGECKID